jgi:microcystin-dependent protein
MKTIELVQYADELKTLYFVLFSDETHSYLSEDSVGIEGDLLRSWLNSNLTVGEFSPVISGGVIPVATIMWFCSQRPPNGYLLCDGSSVSRVQYSQLFRTIGTTYGEGDGRTTFGLPDLVGRFCRGWGPVSPLDPTREFASYQEDEVGLHNHGLQPILHNHTITDPGHVHGVADPGHIHDIVDFGHNHTVSDPGHKHFITDLTHQGWDIFYSRANSGVLRMDIDTGSFFFRQINFVLSTQPSNVDVEVSPANLRLEVAQSNVTTSDAVTNITINEAVPNIPLTEPAGAGETRPDNIALLPVIRY